MKEQSFLLVPFLNTRVINCSGFFRIFLFLSLSLSLFLFTYLRPYRIARCPEESEKIFLLVWRRRHVF
jgi:hypothetical protein